MGSLIVLVNKRADWNVPVSYIKYMSFLDFIFVSIPYIGLVITSHENRWRHFTDSKSCQIIESILKYKNGFKNNLMYKEIFNKPFFENSNRHMESGYCFWVERHVYPQAQTFVATTKKMKLSMFRSRTKQTTLSFFECNLFAPWYIKKILLLC
jgi:hypothetical protein